MIEIRVVKEGDGPLLQAVDGDVFDGPVQPGWAEEFLRDPRHHLVVALEDDSVVGFASGVHYLHPDKPAELWINEVGVAESHRGKRIGARLLRRLLAHGRDLGCREAWVLTEEGNLPAQRLYQSVPEARLSTGVLMFSFPLAGRDDP